LARYSDNDIDEERAVEKFLRVVPKYSQVAIAIEMLMDFFELSIEVTGRLKAVDNRKQLPPSEPVTIGGKLLFTEEQRLARQREQKKGRPRALWIRVLTPPGSTSLGVGLRCFLSHELLGWYTPFPPLFLSFIIVGNGQNLPITCRGESILQTPVSNFPLHNVLVVPS
jgi:hypothetical protein